ncbi:MAG: uroporphyrinogen decarboxylase family protein [Opitutaceae bacterium]|nr:uroporphyrinogen decarboxylase family protein [Opitutaceae bacterium]
MPRQLWVLPIAHIEHGRPALDALGQKYPDDIFSPPPAGALARLIEGDAYAVGIYRDEWGCVFENLQAGVIGEVKQPLLDDWARLDRVKPPEPLLQIDAAEVNRLYAASDKFMTAPCWARPFERMQFLRGSENLYLDLAEEPPELSELIRVVHGYYRKEVEVWSRTRVDALMIMDDWGSQRSLLISPAQWRRLFKPLYREYCDIAHAAGKKIFMHSDGCIADIYEDLIEIGVDAVNSQLFIMDIEAIGRRCKGRITFWGEIDRQQLLPHGTPEECREAVRRVAAALMHQGGGVIAQFEFGAAAKLPNAYAIFDAWDTIRA